jgi:hypothetical protein
LPTVVDSLVVELGLDPSGFVKGQKEAATAFTKTRETALKGAKDIEEGSRKTADAIVTLRDQALSLLAAFAGGYGIKEFVQNITRTDLGTRNLARTLGLTTTELGAWQGAAVSAGGSANAMAGALAGFENQVLTLQMTGQGVYFRFLQEFTRQTGVAIDTTKPWSEQLLRISDAVVKYRASFGAEKANWLINQLGLGGANELLFLGSAGIEKLRRDLAQFQATPADTKAAFDRNVALTHTEALFTSIGRTLTTSLTPALLQVNELLNRFGEWARANPETVKIVFEGITAAVVALSAALGLKLLSSALLTGFSSLIALVRGLAVGFGILSGAAAPWLAIGTVLALLALAIHENWDSIGPWWSKLWDGIGSDSEEGAERIKNSVKGIEDDAKYWGPKIQSLMSSVFGKSYDDWKAGKVDLFGNKTEPGTPSPPAAPSKTSPGTPSDTEAYIRAAAKARGIDPDIAVRVAKSEGLNSYVGDKGTSFGPFQLHYKNNIPGLSLGGLGDVFTKQTGLDARDPSTVKQQIDFALDQAAKGGWGPWHGWRGPANAGIAALGGKTQVASADPASRAWNGWGGSTPAAAAVAPYGTVGAGLSATSSNSLTNNAMSNTTKIDNVNINTPSPDPWAHAVAFNKYLASLNTATQFDTSTVR